MASERIGLIADCGLGGKRICALVGSFSEAGADIVYRGLKTDSFSPDNIDLDFCDRTIVKKQKPRGESYVR
ncbi:hypothetical protein OR1_01786 [Geobacter sp. OR-1]|uniref:hypothetical protein n=1 Tax=Geobacter sp. OR-1 TaxID=1266765 RepID=UPI0005444032|nr:hypothetical protein [Geobacter sp. OR-1]GAM09507.1 hypothetical protein OR1_01786 [Geobacter sp. OR-1]